MEKQLVMQARAVIEELCREARLTPGAIVVVGCSTSEIIGQKIGTGSSPDVAKTVFEAMQEYCTQKGVYLAVQCCEHLNRAIVIEREALPFAEPVNVVPHPHAGGSMATQA